MKQKDFIFAVMYLSGLLLFVNPGSAGAMTPGAQTNLEQRLSQEDNSQKKSDNKKELIKKYNSLLEESQELLTSGNYSASVTKVDSAFSILSDLPFRNISNKRKAESGLYKIKGVNHYHLGNLVEAEEELLRSEELNPRDLGTKQSLAQVLYELKDYKNAEQRVRSILRRKRDGDLLYLLSNIQYKEGRVNDARYSIRKALKDKQKINYYKQLISIDMQLINNWGGGNKRRKMEISREVLSSIDYVLSHEKASGDNSDERMKLIFIEAGIYAQTDHLEKAKNLLEEIIQQSKENSPIHAQSETFINKINRSLTETHYSTLIKRISRTKNNDKAIQIIEENIPQFHNDENKLENLLYLLGDKYYKAGEYHSSINALNQIKRKNARILRLLAAAYYRDGNYEKAVSLIGELKNKTIDDLLFLGNLHTETKAYKKGADDYRRAIGILQNSLTGDNRKEKSVRIKNRIESLHYKLCLIGDETDNIDMMLKNYEQLTNRRDRSEIATDILSKYINREQMDDAINFLRHNSFYIKNSDYILSLMYMKTGRLEESAEEAYKIIGRYSRDAKKHRDLFTILTEGGINELNHRKYKKAIKYLNTAYEHAQRSAENPEVKGKIAVSLILAYYNLDNDSSYNKKIMDLWGQNKQNIKQYSPAVYKKVLRGVILPSL